MMTEVSTTHHLLLICTVGGTPEPVIASIRHWQPTRVLFLHSPGTRVVIDQITAAAGALPPDAWDCLQVDDEQDLITCVRGFRRSEDRVREWLARGAEYQVAVDFTGGTKCMSAAAVLVARRWNAVFSYIGGRERTKGGVGIVVSGRESAIYTRNPWDALGYQAIEDAGLLFDEFAFVPATRLLQEARKSASDDGVKRTLSTLHLVCEGYGLWDRFQHKDALNRLEGAGKNIADVSMAFGATRADALASQFRRDVVALRGLIDHPRSRAMLIDLVANAGRRLAEGRFDDGVARLYRAIEFLAQLELTEHHGIVSTASVPMNQVPEPLRERWTPRETGTGLALGLQDAYVLLEALGNPIGQLFHTLGLADPQKSPLVDRNHSILAHGFKPVPERTFEQLWEATLALARLQEADLPRFPRLSVAAPLESPRTRR